MRGAKWLLAALVVFSLAATASAEQLVARRKPLTPAGRPEVFAVAFSPDGKTLASGEADGTITLWDVAAERPTAAWKAAEHGKLGDWVTSLAYSPNGELLASAGSDAAIRLWNVSTRECVATLNGHDDVVDHVVFTPDGTTLVSGARDGTIRLWTISDRENTAILAVKQSVSGLAVSPDGTMLAVNDASPQVTLWDLARRQKTLALANEATGPVAFSPDGRILATAFGKNRMDRPRFWDVKSGARIADLSSVDDRIVSLAFSPDGKLLAVGTLNGSLRLWNIAEGKSVARGEGGILQQLAFSGDGKLLAAACGDSEGGGDIDLWDVKP